MTEKLLLIGIVSLAQLCVVMSLETHDPEYTVRFLDTQDCYKYLSDSDKFLECTKQAGCANNSNSNITSVSTVNGVTTVTNITCQSIKTTSSSSGLSTGAIVGIAVSCTAVGLIAIFITIWYLCRKAIKQPIINAQGPQFVPIIPANGQHQLQNQQCYQDYQQQPKYLPNYGHAQSQHQYEMAQLQNLHPLIQPGQQIQQGYPIVNAIVMPVRAAPNQPTEVADKTPEPLNAVQEEHKPVEAVEQDIVQFPVDETPDGPA